MSIWVNAIVPVTEMEKDWEKNRGLGGRRVLGERIAGGNQVFCFEHIKFKMVVRHLITSSGFVSTSAQTHCYHLEIDLVSGKKITKEKWIKQIGADFVHIKACAEPCYTEMMVKCVLKAPGSS